MAKRRYATMSRKRTKRKRHSCKTCKPGKTGLANRWSPKDESLLRAFERDRQRGDWSRS